MGLFAAATGRNQMENPQVTERDGIIETLSRVSEHSSAIDALHWLLALFVEQLVLLFA
jgi:hypothetical protein